MYVGLIRHLTMTCFADYVSRILHPTLACFGTFSLKCLISFEVSFWWCFNCMHSFSLLPFVLKSGMYVVSGVDVVHTLTFVFPIIASIRSLSLLSSAALCPSSRATPPSATLLSILACFQCMMNCSNVRISTVRSCTTTVSLVLPRFWLTCNCRHPIWILSGQPVFVFGGSSTNILASMDLCRQRQCQLFLCHHPCVQLGTSSATDRYRVCYATALIWHWESSHSGQRGHTQVIHVD